MRLAKACRHARDEFAAMPSEQRERILDALAKVRELGTSLGECPPGLREAGREMLMGAIALYVGGDFQKAKPTVLAELPELAGVLDLMTS